MWYVVQRHDAPLCVTTDPDAARLAPPRRVLGVREQRTARTNPRKGVRRATAHLVTADPATDRHAEPVTADLQLWALARSIRSKSRKILLRPTLQLPSPELRRSASRLQAAKARPAVLCDRCPYNANALRVSTTTNACRHTSTIVPAQLYSCTVVNLESTGVYT